MAGSSAMVAAARVGVTTAHGASASAVHAASATHAWSASVAGSASAVARAVARASAAASGEWEEGSSSSRELWRVVCLPAPVPAWIEQQTRVELLLAEPQALERLLVRVEVLALLEALAPEALAPVEALPPEQEGLEERALVEGLAVQPQAEALPAPEEAPARVVPALAERLAKGEVVTGVQAVVRQALLWFGPGAQVCCLVTLKTLLSEMLLGQSPRRLPL